MTLEVTSRRDGSVGVVVASGEIDLTSADEFRTAVRAADVDDPDHLVIDLRDVAFIDSTGLSVLVGAANAEQDAGRRIDLVAKGHVRELLRVTGLDTIMTVHADLASAIDSDAAAGDGQQSQAGPVAG